jgi:hypothetical protein
VSHTTSAIDTQATLHIARYKSLFLKVVNISAFGVWSLRKSHENLQSFEVLFRARYKMEGVGGLVYANVLWACGPGSSVGIAIGYALDGPGIELAASVV